MRFFLDTEFIERGPKFPVTLISIGIVRDDGETLYCVSAEFRDEDASEWVKQNVLAQIPQGYPRYSLQSIADEIRAFVGKERPEFWGYYSDYDWVVFAQIFGTMMDLPKGWPMFCLDLKQYCDSLGNPELPEQGKGEHNALADAKWNKDAYDFLAKLERVG
jgi:3' exoribonuclease, RNase T-like